MQEGAAAARGLEDEGFRVLTVDFHPSGADPLSPGQKCLGPNLVGIVGGDGEVYACCFLRGNKAFSFGSLRQEGFEGIWTGERRRQVMEKVYRGECGQVCRGGMTGSRYRAYNQILNYLSQEAKTHVDFV